MLAMLAAEHRRPVSRDELAEELWGEDPPPASDAAIRVLVSKIRGLLGNARAMPGQELLANAVGCYQLQLSRDDWVDVDAAVAAIRVAEAALAAGNVELAGGEALVTSMIARRSFLAGLDGPWVSRQRRNLQDLRIRALECLAAVWLQKGDHGQAIRDSETVVEVDPYRESGYRLLMRAHAAAGNRASVLQAYQRCRQVLAEDLGISPARQTESVYRELG